jgi:hypothetical protein
MEKSRGQKSRATVPLNLVEKTLKSVFTINICFFFFSKMR